MRKTSDFFRNAVLDAFRLEQKEKEEQEMYGELQQYIKENGIEKH
jgi:acid stress-induced BolA-like protein IbaG/YrbA